MAGSGAVWADFRSFVDIVVPKQTIPKLRQFSDKIYLHSGINLGLKSQERKGDVVHKVQAAFNTLQRQDNQKAYLAIRRECELIMAGQASRPAHVSAPPPTFGGVPAPLFGGHHAGNAGSAGSASRIAPHGAPSYALPSRPGVAAGWSTTSGVSNAISSTSTGRLETEPDVDPYPCAVAHGDAASSEGSHTRRERRTHFSLATDIIAKLQLTKSDPRQGPHYSVRLFCASSDYYRPPGLATPPGGVHITNKNIPIEYPSNPDCMLDDHMVPFKERGLRGKPGSAPPLDLNKGSRGLALVPGRMATLQVGHTGPTVGKKKEQSKVVFCEITTIEDLLVKLEALHPTNADEELEKLRNVAADDDDIEVGASALSLKDPLSGMRISKPIRSSKCTHLQCFDARWWLEANRSHPQWLCPHCNKELVFDEIVCDGYFLSILNTVPDSYDEVVLESNGDWHTSDKVHGSLAWKALHRSKSASVAPMSVSTPVKRQRSASLEADEKGKRRAIEILSDSDDDEPSTNGLSNGHASSLPSSSRQASAATSVPQVIDLTLDSDDDDDDDDGGAASVPHFRPPGGASISRGAVDSGARPGDRQPSANGAPAGALTAGYGASHAATPGQYGRLPPPLPSHMAPRPVHWG